MCGMVLVFTDSHPKREELFFIKFPSTSRVLFSSSTVPFYKNTMHYLHMHTHKHIHHLPPLYQPTTFLNPLIFFLYDNVFSICTYNTMLCRVKKHNNTHPKNLFTRKWKKQKKKMFSSLPKKEKEKKAYHRKNISLALCFVNWEDKTEKWRAKCYRFSFPKKYPQRKEMCTKKKIKREEDRKAIVVYFYLKLYTIHHTSNR